MNRPHGKSRFTTRPGDPDGWIRAGDKKVADDGPGFTARMTIDVTPELRGRIKVVAFTKGVTVAEMLRDLLAREFPPVPGAPK